MFAQPLRRHLAAALLSAAGLFILSAPALAQVGGLSRTGNSFALLGDVPYSVTEEVKFDNVIADINATRGVRFVLHNGDVKSGSESCGDALLTRRFNQFQNFVRGFVITPGDNDWTDCHRVNNGAFLPTERLTRFREIYYPVPGRTTGQRPFTVDTQASVPGYAKYVENMMWSFAGTTMATVHVVGSNNNLDPWTGIDPGDSYTTPRADRIAEFNEREAAALVWIDTVFDRAVQQASAGVLIAWQANPNFELASTAQQRQGFNKVLDKLGARAQAFGKPVVLAHGDSHYFRLDKPLVRPIAPSGNASLENFTRAENFGTPQVHWVEVFVDARDPNVFTFVPRLVRANFFPR